MSGEHEDHIRVALPALLDELGGCAECLLRLVLHMQFVERSVVRYRVLLGT